MRLRGRHADNGACLPEGKARKPYESGVKASIVVIHGKGLVLGTRTFPKNSYDGHTLAAQIEKSTTLLAKISVKPAMAVVDMIYRGVEAERSSVQILHRGK